MERTSFAEMQCSLAQSFEIIGDWWTPLIIRDLFLGLDRFDDLVENLGVSRNLLTRRLRSLLERGIVDRRPYAEKPKRYAYRLTEAGLALAPVLAALTAWGDKWAPPRGGGVIAFEHLRCGCQFTPRIVCSECADEIRGEEMRGVGAAPVREGPGTRVLARRLPHAKA